MKLSALANGVVEFEVTMEEKKLQYYYHNLSNYYSANPNNTAPEGRVFDKWTDSANELKIDITISQLTRKYLEFSFA